MLLAIPLLVVVQIGSGASPPPAPSSTPLKEIGHVRSSALCTVLRDNLSPAIDGLRINDSMIDRGQALLIRTARDAAAYAASASAPDATNAVDPFAHEAGANAGSASATGGASAGSAMDAYQLGILSHNLEKNLEKIQALLDDPHSFSATPASDDDRVLALARASLQAVVARQRASLNILSGVAETNAANDLKSRRDIIPYDYCTTCSQTVPFTPIGAPRTLADATGLTRRSEAGVAPAVSPIGAECR
ncbi:MAG TPA: hypothetical protein VHX17_13255 [Candidatus Cybelea sp.]|jgi:hypothetical protein|nr:hypothetical protein [Candidatus Cybelea sp.]